MRYSYAPRTWPMPDCDPRAEFDGIDPDDYEDDGWDPDYDEPES